MTGSSPDEMPIDDVMTGCAVCDPSAPHRENNPTDGIPRRALLGGAVGAAMGANPIPLIIPCHRVLASDGRPGGFSAPGGAESKLRMLELEGVLVGTPPGQMTFGF